MPGLLVALSSEYAHLNKNGQFFWLKELLIGVFLSTFPKVILKYASESLMEMANVKCATMVLCSLRCFLAFCEKGLLHKTGDGKTL